MNKKEILKNYLGEEIWEKFLKNSGKTEKTIDSFLDHYENPSTIIHQAFSWGNSSEGRSFWNDIFLKLCYKNWDDLCLAVSAKEQDLIFKMFVCEYMSWHYPDYFDENYFYENSLGRKIYDALREEK